MRGSRFKSQWDKKFAYEKKTKEAVEKLSYSCILIIQYQGNNIIHVV